jgi:hypothetical protein
MHWIISKALFGGALLASFGAVADVPVSDSGTQEAVAKVEGRLETMDEKFEALLELTELQVKIISESGASNLEMLKSNSKALTNINQALANVIVGTAKGQSQAVEMRRNADLYDEKMGAKPSSACGVLSPLTQERKEKIMPLQKWSNLGRRILSAVVTYPLMNL